MNKLDQQYYTPAQHEVIHPGGDQQQAEGQSIQVSYELEDVIICYALQLQKPLQTLTLQDFIELVRNMPIPLQLEFSLQDHYQQVIATIIGRLEQKIEQGMMQCAGKTIVHTAPHHDDIILGYHPYVTNLLHRNNNHMLYMTNGFHGVSDEYLKDLILQCVLYDQTVLEKMVLQNFYQQLIQVFAQAFHEHHEIGMQQARHYIFLKIVAEVFGCTTPDQLAEQLRCLQDGVQDVQKIDVVKGRLRQSESDSKWMIAQGHCSNVTHFGAACYEDDSYAAFEADVECLAIYFRDIKPDLVTVALDLCGIGPASHFMSLQVIAKALQLYGNEAVEIIGYRNVWSNFTISKTSMIVPVTQQEIEAMQSVFAGCFATQKNPLFPCPGYDGPFSDMVAQNLQQQGDDIALLLGKDKDCDYLFLQKLTLNELLQMTSLED